MGVRMEIIRKSLGDVPLLEICEDIDHSTAEEFHRAVHDALDERKRLLLDLSGCRYVDSGGLAVILATTKELNGGGWLGVVAGSKNVSRLFHLVGLDSEPAFCQFSDLAAAERCLVVDVR
jgi:anti-anti-sigma factor